MSERLSKMRGSSKAERGSIHLESGARMEQGGRADKGIGSCNDCGQCSHPIFDLVDNSPRSQHNCVAGRAPGGAWTSVTRSPLLDSIVRAVNKPAFLGRSVFSVESIIWPPYSLTFVRKDMVMVPSFVFSLKKRMGKVNGTLFELALREKR